MWTIGIDVGGTKTAYGLFDRTGSLCARRQHSSNSTCGPEAFFDEIAENIRGFTAEAGITLGELRGVGIGMPSFIVYEEGSLVKTSNLVNIHDFGAREYLRKKLEAVRVLIDNDTHVATLAEQRRGAGRGFEDMIYCAVSTGIASGCVINGKLFRGRYGWAGESGHALVDPDDPEAVSCGCGNRGCLMSWCSGSMIVKHIRNWIASGEKTLLTELAGDAEHITAAHLDAAWDAGDPLARRAVEQMAKSLSIWLYNLYASFNINCFVLGGGLVKMGDKLFGRIRTRFDEFNQDERPVYFKFAELKEDAGIIGAAELFSPP
jgi:glucokinase